jgi:putative mRNA 3-end processing factor
VPIDELIVQTERGPYCPLADVHVDPWAPVRCAIVTHAHSDHATRGCAEYIATPETCRLLQLRLGPAIATRPLPYLQQLDLADARLTLHPAGHVLGSAQVRLEPVGGGPVWVVTGDYKTDPDPTCAPFESVGCDVLLTESTFALPIYRWPAQEQVFVEINDWWRSNQAEGRTTMLLTYSLGKAQRVLAGLDPSIGPIAAHGAVLGPTEVYRSFDINLPPLTYANADSAAGLKGKACIIATPASTATNWPKRFAGPGGIRMAFVSGWMRVRGRRRWQSADRGFVLSDHADWSGLLDAIDATGARRVGVTHGYAAQLARYLRDARSLDTFVMPTRYRGEQDLDADAPSRSPEPH